VKSGFATLVGRPNVGKSTLLNTILGQKVSITSPVAQTTRNQVRGVLNPTRRPSGVRRHPGIHKPRTLLGERSTTRPADALGGVDVTVARPRRHGAEWAGVTVSSPTASPVGSICVVNKVDAASATSVLQAAGGGGGGARDLDEYFPVSARTGAGVDALVEAVIARLPEGPQLYPADMVTDVQRGVLGGRAGPRTTAGRDARRGAALHRLPGDGVGVAADPLRDPGGAGLAEGDRDRPRRLGPQRGRVAGPGPAAPGAFLELFVKVDRDWQSRPKALERLGY
jgi:GTP-binding protein Era